MFIADLWVNRTLGSSFKYRSASYNQKRKIGENVFFFFKSRFIILLTSKAAGKSPFLFRNNQFTLPLPPRMKKWTLDSFIRGSTAKG